MRGGARKGSGRKAGAEGTRQTFTCRVSKETQNRLRELKDNGVAIGEMFDDFIENLYEKKGQS